MSEAPEIEVWGGEEELLAILLSVIRQSCATKGGKLDSWALTAYARAMRELHSCGLIGIEDEFARRIIAKVTPEGEAFLTRLYEEERKETLRMTEFFRQRALEAYHCRREHPVLSAEWWRQIKEARARIKAYRHSKGYEGNCSPLPFRWIGVR